MIERSSSIPLIVLTASSTGLVMEVSISSGLAPGLPSAMLPAVAAVKGVAATPNIAW